MEDKRPMAILSQDNWKEPTKEHITGIKDLKRRLIKERLTSSKSKTLKEGSALERLNWTLADWELFKHVGERLLTDAELRKLYKFPSKEMKEKFHIYNNLFSAFSRIEPYVVLAYSSYQVEADELIHHISLHESKVRAQMERCSLLTAMRSKLKASGALPEEVIQKMLNEVMQSATLKGEEFVYDEGLEAYVFADGGSFPTSGESIVEYARGKKAQIQIRLSTLKGYACAIDDTLIEYEIPRTFLPLMVRSCIEETEKEAHLDFMHVDRQYRQSYVNDIKKAGGEEWEMYKAMIEDLQRQAEADGTTFEDMVFLPDYREIRKDEKMYESVKRSLRI